MNSPILSIIIPCYNCASTLTGAVQSCFNQGLANSDFEIIMVDDGSTDSTRSVMESLRESYDNITLLFHAENRGGGAARNTGIKASRGNVLYCLDSDNIFAPNSISALLQHITTTGHDGAAFHERRFFYGKNKERYTTHTNPLQQHSITLVDIFTTDTLLDNFFFTRAAYDRTDGYPEHHGFDTQCYEVRFLAANNTVSVCPQSIFYHRHATGEPSYFERVHSAGLFSVNMMLILEEIFHLLTPQALEQIINFSIFTHTNSGGENVRALASKLATEGVLFSATTVPSRAKWLNTSASIHRELVAAVMHIAQNKPGDALTSFYTWQQRTRITSQYTYFLYLRIGVLATGYPPARHVTETFRIASSIIPIPRTQYGYLWRSIRSYALVQWLVRILKRINL